MRMAWPPGSPNPCKQRFRPIRRHAIISVLHARFVHHAKSQTGPNPALARGKSFLPQTAISNKLSVPTRRSSHCLLQSHRMPT